MGTWKWQDDQPLHHRPNCTRKPDAPDRDGPPAPPVVFLGLRGFRLDACCSGRAVDTSSAHFETAVDGSEGPMPCLDASGQWTVDSTALALSLLCRTRTSEARVCPRVFRIPSIPHRWQSTDPIHDIASIVAPAEAVCNTLTEVTHSFPEPPRISPHAALPGVHAESVEPRGCLVPDYFPRDNGSDFFPLVLWSLILGPLD